MGTNNIQYDLGLIDTDETFTTLIQLGAAKIAFDTTNGVQYDLDGGDGGYYRTLLRNITNGMKLCIISKSAHADNCVMAWVKIDDTYYAVSMSYAGAAKIGWYKGTTRPSASTVFTDTATGITLSKFSTIGLEFVAGGNVDVKYGNEVTQLSAFGEDMDTVVTTMTNTAGAAATTWTGNKITEIGFFFDVASANNASIAMLHQGADKPTALAGALTQPNEIVKYHAVQYLGDFGLAEIEFYDPNYAEMATHLANYGKQSEFYSDRGMLLVEATMEGYEAINKYYGKYEFKIGAQFLADIIIDVKAILESYILRAFNVETLTLTIWDRDATFGQYGTLNRYIIFRTADNKKRVHNMKDGSTVEDSLGNAPEHTDGAFLNTYDYDGGTDYTNDCWHTGESTDLPLYQIMKFPLFTGSVAYVTGLKLIVQIATRPLGLVSLYIDIYDHTAGAWDLVKLFTTSEFGGSALSSEPSLDDPQGNSSSPILNATIDIVEEMGTITPFTPADHIKTVSGEEREIWIRYRVTYAVGSYDATINNWQSLIEVTLNTEEDPVKTVYDPLDYVTNPDNIPFTRSAGDFAANYFSVGDQFDVVYDISAYFTAVFASLSPTYSLDINVTGISGKGMEKEFYNKPLRSLLKWITDTYNAIWWIDYEAQTCYIRSIDNLTASGLTIAGEDAQGGRWWPRIDTSNVYDKIIVIGANNSYTKTLSPDFTRALQSRTKTYHEPNVYSYDALKAIGDNRATFHESPILIISIVMMPTFISDIQWGQEVTAKFPSSTDTSLINGTMIVKGFESTASFETGHREELTIILEKRY